VIGPVKICALAVLAAFGVSNAQTSEFNVYKTGTFYHALSTLHNAWDLEADAGRMASDADATKDFVNIDVGGYDGEFKAGNTSAYVNAPGYPTFNAQTGSKDFTFAKIDSIYKAGPVITQQNNPGTGSRHVYIVKMRGTDTYVIVKFTGRIGNNNDCNCANPGMSTFEYWKFGSSSPTAVKRSMIAAKKRPARLVVNNGRLVIDRSGTLSIELPAMNLLGRTVPGVQLQVK
jgi:hypothetical protein